MTRESKIGIFLAGALAILAAVIFVVGDLSEVFKKPGYRLDVVVDSALGLESSSSVKMAGIKIGRIKDIRLKGKRALIVMNIYPQFKVPLGSKGSLASLGLLGEKFLDIIPSESKQFYEPGATLEGLPAVSFDQIGVLIISIGDEIKEVSRSLRDMLDKDTGKNLRETLENLSKLTAELNDLVVRNKGSIGETVSAAATAFKDMSQKIREISDNLNGAASKYGTLAEENRETVRESLDKVRDVVSKIGEAVDKLNDSLDKIRNNEGTLGKLVNEKKLYDDVADTVNDVKDIIKPVSAMKAGLELRGDYYGKSDLIKGSLTFRLWTGGRKLFMGQVIHDPWRDRVTYSLQGGFRMGNFVPRAGIIESQFGAGLEYVLFKDRLAFGIEGFDFNRTPKPIFRAFTKYYPAKNLFFVFGIDDIGLASKREMYFGMGVGLQ